MSQDKKRIISECQRTNVSPLVRPHGATLTLVDAGDILLKGCMVQMKRVDEGGPAQSETDKFCS